MVIVLNMPNKEPGMHGDAKLRMDSPVVALIFSALGKFLVLSFSFGLLQKLDTSISGFSFHSYDFEKKKTIFMLPKMFVSFESQ